MLRHLQGDATTDLGWCSSSPYDPASDGRSVPPPFSPLAFSLADPSTLLFADTSPPIERLAMYECAVAQVYSLCSLDSLTYELGVDARSNSARWGNASGEQRPEFLVRARVYWYCFGESQPLFSPLAVRSDISSPSLAVHEAIKTGLKGGRLIMFVPSFPFSPHFLR